MQMMNDDGEQTYSHYFKSKCHPACPDIIVKEIEAKKKFHLGQVQVSLGLDSVGVQSRTVKEVKSVESIYIFHSCQQTFMY